MKIGKFLTEAANVASVQKKIEQLKKKLQNSKMKENFGEKEIRALKDSIHMEEFTKADHKKVLTMIDEFDDWCGNYTGN